MYQHTKIPVIEWRKDEDGEGRVFSYPVKVGEECSPQCPACACIERDNEWKAKIEAGIARMEQQNKRDKAWYNTFKHNEGGIKFGKELLEG